METNASTSNTTSVDFTQVVENQVKEYNMVHDYFLFSTALNGLLIALILVLIFAKGYQSNAR